MAKAVTLKNNNNEEIYPVTDISLVNGELNGTRTQEYGCIWITIPVLTKYLILINLFYISLLNREYDKNQFYIKRGGDVNTKTTYIFVLRVGQFGYVII